MFKCHISINAKNSRFVRESFAQILRFRIPEFCSVLCLKPYVTSFKPVGCSLTVGSYSRKYCALIYPLYYDELCVSKVALLIVIK